VTEISRTKAIPVHRQDRTRFPLFYFRVGRRRSGAAVLCPGTPVFAVLLQALFLAPVGLPEPAPALADEAREAPAAYDKQINFVYTINNFGWTDVCG